MYKKKNYDKTLLGAINQNYVYVSNNMTEIYTQRYGFYCDLYFPRHKENPDSKGEYIRENICPHYIRESKIVYEKQRRKCNKTEKKEEEKIAKIAKIYLIIAK